MFIVCFMICTFKDSAILHVHLGPVYAEPSTLRDIGSCILDTVIAFYSCRPGHEAPFSGLSPAVCLPRPAKRALAARLVQPHAVFSSPSFFIDSFLFCAAYDAIL